MPKLIFCLFCAAFAVLLTGCSSTISSVTASAGGKNLNLDGYLMFSELETANPETATPCGKLVIGRVTYKSRKVSIPADHKVPTAGYFKSTKTKSLFGISSLQRQNPCSARKNTSSNMTSPPAAMRTRKKL